VLQSRGILLLLLLVVVVVVEALWSFACAFALALDTGRPGFRLL